MEIDQGELRSSFDEENLDQWDSIQRIADTRFGWLMLRSMTMPTKSCHESNCTAGSKDVKSAEVRYNTKHFC